MKKYRSGFVAILLLLGSAPVFGQYYSTGSDPANIKWRQIETAHFQIIYPNDYEQQAQGVAAKLETVYPIGYKSLGTAPRKIAVILHTRTINSNGLVAWSPSRMELFPTPNQQVYAQDWIDQLVVHEFRHVVQMNELETNTPFIFKALFGEQAAAAIAGLYLPFWFLEGDAVVAETALTETGRGRNPSFLMENKAQALQKGLYSFDKATLGSYKDYVPNRYNFGWYMVAGIRGKYGEQVWGDVVDKVARQPYSVNPLNRVLKQHTGKNKEHLYSEIFSDYRVAWSNEVAGLNLSPLKNLSQDTAKYANYVYTGLLDDGSLVAYKQSRKDIGRIVRIQDGRELSLFTPGTILEESFSARGQKLIWSERRADVRWDHADKSVIVVYDLTTRKKQEFQSTRKLFSPVISPDKTKFAAVVVDDKNQYSIGVFSLKNGQLLNEFHPATNDYLISPTWDEQQKELYFIGLNDAGKYLGKLSLETAGFSMLTEPSRVDMRNLCYQNHQLYYTSAASGIDNVYRFDLDSCDLVQLTNVAFGADYPLFDGKQLYFSNYSAEGYKIVSLDSSDFLNQPTVYKRLVSNPTADQVAQQEGEIIDFSAIDSVDYQSKRYSKLTHLFNFHSWAPAYVDMDNYDVRPGVSFFSQNKLGTATANMGYDYDWSERTGKVRASFEYKGLFPIISAEVNYGNRKSAYRLIQQSGDTISVPFSWNELSYEFGTRVPLRFSQGKWSQLIQPELKYAYKKVIHDESTPHQFYNGYYHSMAYRMYAQNVLRTSELDLVPRWGQAVDIIYKNSPAGGTKIGDLKAIQTYLYFPGLLRNQGIRIYNGFQKKETDQDILFADVVRFPRGLQRVSSTDLYTFSADYFTPLGYPDLNISRLVYLKRLRASLFYDFSSLKGNTYSSDGSVYSIYKKYRTSMGVELIGDGHFLRLPAPVSLGVRSMYLLDYNQIRFEMLLSVDFGAI